MSDDESDSIIEAEGTTPARAFALEMALYPVTSKAEWAKRYRKWKGRGVNLEGLILTGQVNDWIPADIAAELVG